MFNYVCLIKCFKSNQSTSSKTLGFYWQLFSTPEYHIQILKTIWWTRFSHGKIVLPNITQRDFLFYFIWIILSITANSRQTPLEYSELRPIPLSRFNPFTMMKVLKTRKKSARGKLTWVNVGLVERDWGVAERKIPSRFWVPIWW